MYGSGSNDKLYKHDKTGSAAQAAGTTNSGGTASAGSPSVTGMTKPDGCLAGKPDQSVQGEVTPVAKQVTITKVTELQAPDGTESSHARLIDQAWQVVERKKKHPKGANPKSAANQEANPKPRKPSQKQRRRAQEKARAEAAAAGSTTQHRSLPQTQTSGTAAGGACGGTVPGETRPREQHSVTNTSPGTAEMVRGAEVPKQKAANRPDKRTRIRLAKKRARMNETVSPSGELKKPRVEKPPQQQPRTSYAEATKQDFAVAIAKADGILTQEGADSILMEIQLRMISEARARSSDDKGPVFRAKPSFAEGYLRLWGDDQKTVDWLKQTVSAMTLPSGEKLTVKSQADIPKRTRVGILIPDPMGVWKETKDIGHVLAWQNKWAQCERWLVQKALKQAVGWFMVVSVPNDLVPTLVEKRRCLSCLLGAVYIRFQGPGGKYYETPPEGTIQGTKGLKITGVQMPRCSSPAQGSSTMSVAEEVRGSSEVTDSDMDEAQKPTEDATLKAFEDLLLDSEGDMSSKDGVPFV
ncbi:hypothetical protein O0L34_g5546 [Tuta absoluta]|nr:hypothetical protein O0L34_g5546 [Tuta absoluta]